MNLLKTKAGRLAAFGDLYLSEGLPQGLSGFALTLKFKRREMDAAAISTLTAMIALPWAWKFLMGPFVDNVHLRRFGPANSGSSFAKWACCWGFASL